MEDADWVEPLTDQTKLHYPGSVDRPPYDDGRHLGRENLLPEMDWAYEALGLATSKGE